MNLAGIKPFRLPPLILHPFSAPDDASKLMESTKANLALQGILPKTAKTPAELDEQLLRGRYAELKMLFYIGKDVLRWMDQCAESAAVSDCFFGRKMQPETFALYLVQYVPYHVRTKLEDWGVVDFCGLFRRSLGLHTVFANLPSAQDISADFLRRYHRHLDVWYEYRMRDRVFDRAEENEFTFDLFASGEYTLMLEKSWGENSE